MLLEPPGPDGRPLVVIIGGGFAGLAAARGLRRAPVRVLLVDRRNHHVFQPLLYQVATAALSPADIAAPIRGILRRVRNCSVALAEPTRIDLANRSVEFGGDAVAYDWLIVAAGATHSYFGNDDWATIAPGLKSLEDATEIRRRLLLAFENAEYEGDPDARRAALTFAVVGGGPTGVELAGAIKEIAAESIPRDFRNIDTTTTRVILLQGGDRVLEAFPPSLSERARRDLEAMGVEVRLNARVTNVTEEGVYLGEEFLPVHTVFWAAGVRGSPLAETMGVERDRAGRVVVGPDLSVPRHPSVFVVGDLAAARSADTGQPVPGVAQGAIQMGRYVARIIARETASGTVGQTSRLMIDTVGQTSRLTIPSRKPFVYRDKGSMATIGKARAVADIKGLRFAGFVAWAMWAGIHVISLISFRDRMMVLMGWAWYWATNSRDVRLITGDARLKLSKPIGQSPAHPGGG